MAKDSSNKETTKEETETPAAPAGTGANTVPEAIEHSVAETEAEKLVKAGGDLLPGGLLPAVFIGNGRHRSKEDYPAGYKMTSVWPTLLAFDAEGNVLPTKDPKTGRYRNPQELPQFSHMGEVTLYPGELAYLPAGNPELFAHAVVSELFVDASHEKTIKEWQKDGLDWYEIVERAKERDWLIKPLTSEHEKAVDARLVVLGKKKEG